MARLLYFLRQGMLHIGRSPFVAGITVATMAAVFLVLSVFALFGYNLATITERIGQELKLSVFVKDDADENQKGAIGTLLKSSDLVDQVQWVDAASAFRRFQAQLGPQAGLLEGMGDNLLPASFEAVLLPAARDPHRLANLADALRALPGVEDLQYGQAWLQQFFEFVRLGKWVGGIVGLLIVFATMMIVSNTIRLSVFARREEILILKLVGATDGFVKAPFFIEGVLLSACGAAVGLAGTWLLFSLLEPVVLIPAGLGGGGMPVSFLPSSLWLPMLGGGAALGLLGTWMSLWRHLKI